MSSLTYLLTLQELCKHPSYQSALHEHCDVRVFMCDCVDLTEANLSLEKTKMFGVFGGDDLPSKIRKLKNHNRKELHFSFARAVKIGGNGILNFLSKHLCKPNRA